MIYLLKKVLSRMNWQNLKKKKVRKFNILILSKAIFVLDELEEIIKTAKESRTLQQSK